MLFEDSDILEELQKTKRGSDFNVICLAAGKETVCLRQKDIATEVDKYCAVAFSLLSSVPSAILNSCIITILGSHVS